MSNKKYNNIMILFMRIVIPLILIGFGIFITFFIVNSNLNANKENNISAFKLFSSNIFFNFKSSLQLQEAALLDSEQFYSTISSDVRTIGNYT